MAVCLIDGFQFFAKKREMSILRYYSEFYENTANNRFYPILSSLDVVFWTKTKVVPLGFYL